MAHELSTGGHLGRGKTKAKIRERLYWPRLLHKVGEYCALCPVCQKITPNHSSGAPLVPLLIKMPFERVVVDIVGLLPKSSLRYQSIHLREKLLDSCLSYGATYIDDTIVYTLINI